MTIIKTLSKSIREFKKDSILSPVFVVLEVILECMLPFFTARLINQMKQGTTMSTILYYGFILFVMAMLSLLFGIQAGNFAASASTGFARNLRRDLFQKIQSFSFGNIFGKEKVDLHCRSTF